jgi:hypothetical protein
MSVTTILFILVFAGMIAMHLRGHGGHGGHGHDQGHGSHGHDQGHGSHGGCGGGHGHGSHSHSHGSEPAEHPPTEVGDRDSTDHHATHR